MSYVKNAGPTATSSETLIIKGLLENLGKIFDQQAKVQKMLRLYGLCPEEVDSLGEALGDFVVLKDLALYLLSSLELFSSFPSGSKDANRRASGPKYYHINGLLGPQTLLFAS